MSKYKVQSTVSSQPPRQICTHFRLFCSPPPRESRVSGYSWRSQFTQMWRHRLLEYKLQNTPQIMLMARAWLQIVVVLVPFDCTQTFRESMFMIPKITSARQDFTHRRRVTHMRHHWFKKLICSLFSAKPLSEPKLFFQIGPLGTTICENWITIQQFPYKKLHLKKSPAISYNI